MQVDGPGADGAAAGQRDPGAALAGEQRAQHQDRGAHGLDEVVGRLDRGEVAGLDLDDAARRGTRPARPGRAGRGPWCGCRAPRARCCRTTGLSVRSAAQTSGSEAFLAPEMRTVPFEGLAADDADLFHDDPVYAAAAPAATSGACRRSRAGCPAGRGARSTTAKPGRLATAPRPRPPCPGPTSSDQRSRPARSSARPRRRPGGGRAERTPPAGTRASARLVVADLGREAAALGRGRRRAGC